jgi:hypothetical protein
MQMQQHFWLRKTRSLSGVTRHFIAHRGLDAFSALHQFDLWRSISVRKCKNFHR